MKAEKIIRESLEVKEKFLELKSELEKVERAAKLISSALKRGKKVLLFGNGGSAADAQHIACELSGRFKKERRGLPAIALTTNTSSLTAIANDYSYEDVFSRQLEGLVSKGDIVIGISTSGRSPNVIKGVRVAREKGAVTIGLTGLGGTALEKEVDLCIKVPSNDTPRIQEVHVAIGHAICEMVEEELFGS
jgi:D-sedoheptulose 7-phosphate isomerase